MSTFTAEHERNEAAFRRLKPMIDGAYPVARFVAIHGGRIVADAENLAALRERLAALSIPPREALVVRAGVEYAASAVIFTATSHECRAARC